MRRVATLAVALGLLAAGAGSAHPVLTARAAANSSSCPHSTVNASLFNGTWDGAGYISDVVGRVCWNGHRAWEAAGSPLNDSTVCSPSATKRCPNTGCSLNWVLGRHPKHTSISIYWCGVVGNDSSNLQQGVNYCIGYGKGVYGNPKPAYVVIWGRYPVRPDGPSGNPILETVQSGYRYGSCPTIAHQPGKPKPAPVSKLWATVSARTPADLSTGYLEMGPMSCVSSRECVVGSSLDELDAASSTYAPLLWNWNGRSWSSHPGPGGGSQQLVGSACGSASSCWVTGTAGSGTASTPVIDHFNGRSWSASPGPAVRNGIALNGVACASASDCFAVGDDETSDTAAKAVVEHYNGHRWSPMAVPSPSGFSFSNLTSVSCDASSGCMALGIGQLAADSAANDDKATFFGENYNGRSWSIVTVATATQAYQSTQTALIESGCIRANGCLAVGAALDYDASGGAAFPSPLAEDYDGGAWVPASPGPDASIGPGGVPEEVNGVSCLADSYCWVAMSPAPPEDPVGSPAALAYWDGQRFTISHLAQDGAMYAIACLPGGWCMALGEGQGANHATVMLAEEDDPAPAASLPGRPHG